ncbi:MAG: homoserine kinase [Ginsengibacter sp.]
MQEVKVSCPATVANMVCGFDILGFAVHEPADIIHLKRSEKKGLTIRHLDDYRLPLNPLQNVAGVSLLELMQEIDPAIGFEMVIDKKIMPGSGLGSSAASAAGAVVAANYLLGNSFGKDELVKFAMAGEKLACGVKHADNIAPAIFGGVTLIRSIFPLDIIELPGPELFVIMIHPQIELKTSDARQILRKQVLLKDAIRQWGNIGGLITGLMKHDYALIGRSLEDVIIEPMRSILIPRFDELKRSCLAAGALGGGIAGSGPSVFMFAKDNASANAVKDVMHKIYEPLGIEFNIYSTTINYQGVQLLESGNDIFFDG